MTPNTRSRLLPFLAALAAVLSGVGCTAALGPGYTIEKQDIDVHFAPGPQPAIHIDSVYRLRNDGNQPLTSLEMRLPGRRRFNFTDARAEWNGHDLPFAVSPGNSRNVVLAFPDAWAIASTQTLKLSIEYHPAAGSGKTFGFAPDAFCLPAEGWSAQLLPARGAFATGGIPPKKWLLTVRVPEGFLVHASGRKPKVSRNHGEQTLLIPQQGTEGYPFVIAGRYTKTQFSASSVNVNLWSRATRQASSLQDSAAALVAASRTYDAMFGKRNAPSHALWIVECPVAENCFTSTASNYAKLIAPDGAKPTAEMASLDAVMVDLSSGKPDVVAAAAPSLASGWLGYGQNPGFFEQDPPLAALPAFASAQGRQAVQGPQVRSDTIRRVLREIPLHGVPGKPEDAGIVRAKSLLFFYALQDRYGADVFHHALTHMLYARRGGGFDLDDLIAAFEQETHQNVAEFVRHWMKHPGVPDDFRARYETSTGALASNPKETTP